jgi:hypothetical protein
MPHDANGELLKVGDRVVLYGTITYIGANPEYCNCSVELEYKMPPDNQVVSVSALNTKQVVKREKDALQLGAEARAAGIV